MDNFNKEFNLNFEKVLKIIPNRFQLIVIISYISYLVLLNKPHLEFNQTFFNVIKDISSNKIDLKKINYLNLLKN